MELTTFYVFRMKSCNDDVARGGKNTREATEGMRCVEIVAYLFTGKTALGHSPAKNQCLLYYSHMFKKKQNTSVSYDPIRKYSEYFLPDWVHRTCYPVISESLSSLLLRPAL